MVPAITKPTLLHLLHRVPFRSATIISPRGSHLTGWILLGLISFFQPLGYIAADTKHDLLANPGHFLAGAQSAWTDTFTLGQLQNQAYGYLFPHGAFFWLFDAFPDAFTQRLWWWLVLGVGYSGFLLLLRRIADTSGGLAGSFTTSFAMGAAFLYALSPRVLSTLTTISSETWPVMLAPWVLWPLITRRLTLRSIAMSVLAIGMMGAVNATATLAACTPAGIFLLWRLMVAFRWRLIGLTMMWGLGAVLISLWWILPLLVLGRYASPFTDYIENATVVTRWLNLAEILRGTTSWSPFVDAERQAGHALATDPYLIIFTLAVAGLGLYGLTRVRNLQGFWVTLLGIGLIVLGGAHHVTGFLDGAGVALRNIHKFDPLVRLPLLVGFAQLWQLFPAPKPAQPGAPDGPPRPVEASVGARQFLMAWLPRHPQRAAALALIILVSVSAVSPAWAGRLLPLGAYRSVPDYWAKAAEFLNHEAHGTRTLILPASSFARQTWGWTRDEPAQPLLDVPWAVRDAIPLVTPEAIRGLDGISAYPTPENLARLGIGAVIVRHDLARSTRNMSAERLFPQAKIHRFGEVEVVILNRNLGMTVVDSDRIPTVAGGGESLALLGSGTYRLVGQGASIVTDTPLLVGRNYGSLNSVSAPLADAAEAKDVHNRVIDYPSVGPFTKVVESGGQVRASSSAGDATSFAGSRPGRAVTAAVDGLATTAWWPRPGTQRGEWIELQPDTPLADPVLEVLLTASKPVRAEVIVTADDRKVTKRMKTGERVKIPIPGGMASKVRLTLGAAAAPIGVAELAIAHAPITRNVTVPDTSLKVRQFVFNQVFSYTEQLQRRFTVPRTMRVRVDLSACVQRVYVDGARHECGDTITLTPGVHQIRTGAQILKLTEVDFDPTGAPTTPLTHLKPATRERLIITNRAANDGLIGTLDGTPLTPTTINSGIQAFIVPPGHGGEFHLSFAGDHPYRQGLIIGSITAGITALLCAIATVRRRQARHEVLHITGGTYGTVIICGGLALTTGWPILILIPLTWLVLRYTLIGRGLLIAATMTMTAMWLARAPWPAANYAGDSPLLACACAIAVITMCISLRHGSPEYPQPTTPKSAPPPGPHSAHPAPEPAPAPPPADAPPQAPPPA